MSKNEPFMTGEYEGYLEDGIMLKVEKLSARSISIQKNAEEAIAQSLEIIDKTKPIAIDAVQLYGILSTILDLDNSECVAICIYNDDEHNRIIIRHWEDKNTFYLLSKMFVKEGKQKK